MKTALLSLLSATLLAPVALAQTTIITDNFDSYTPGTLAKDALWPSSIPGTLPPLSWRTSPPASVTSPGGTQSIVSGSAVGRTGNVYHYQENATGQRTTFSSVDLGAPSGLDQWQLSLDLYLDEVTPVSSSFFNLITLANGDVMTAANRLTTIGISRRSASPTGDLVFAYLTADGTRFEYSSNADGKRIALDTWYTLTLTGDNTTGTFTITITGEDFAFTSTPLQFANGLTDFSSIAIGDTADNAWAAGRSNSVYLDNLRLQAIPEPSTVALIPVALGLFGAARLLRHRRSH